MSAMLSNSRAVADPVRRGFTLIEVLVTVVILSIGIVAVLRAFQGSLTALDRSRSVIRAHMIIKEKIADLQLLALQNKKGWLNTVPRFFDPKNKAFKGEMRVKQLRDSLDGTRSMSEVTVIVWRENYDKARYSAATYIAEVESRE